ncbi:MAG: PQQ-binding-like beta-propeller repeat protein [Anaerolineales bacterium]
MRKKYFMLGSLVLPAAFLAAGCQAVPAEPAASRTGTSAPAADPSPAGPTLEPGFRAPLWTFATAGEVWSSPTVAGGTVYFGSDDHALYAVDIPTRQLKWKFETGDRVRSRPAAADGIVYFTNDENRLYAVDAADGSEVWHFEMGTPAAPRLPIPDGWDYQQSSPAVADGIVYAGSAGPQFFAVDAKTGEEVWRIAVGGYVRSSPAVAGGVVYFGDWIGLFYALDARTGKEKWSFDTQGAVVPSPTIADGVVYIGSKFPCLYALDAQTGEKKWCYAYPPGAAWVESSAAVAGGTVYVGSSDWFRVNAIDAATGSEKWHFLTKGDPWSSPAVSEGVVYIGATSGLFYALDAVHGKENWKVETGKALVTFDPIRFNGGVVSSPFVAEGVVYFGALDGKLYAVSTAA